MKIINHTGEIRRFIKLSVFILSIIGSRSADAKILDCSGKATLEDLVGCITGQMPQPRAGKVIEANAQESLDWRQIVRQMMQGHCTNIPIPYSLNGKIQTKSFTDSENRRSYCALMEVLDSNNDGVVDHGYGTFITRSNATRELNHAVPHPLSDYPTELEAISIFKNSNSRSFLMAGAQRYTSTLPSKCQSSYMESDAAHNAGTNLFYVTTQELNEFYGTQNWAQIQWNAMASNSCPDVNVYMTYGLTYSAPPENSKLMTLRSNLLKHHPSWKIDIPSDSPSCGLDGSNHTEGLFLNNVEDQFVCSHYANSATLKFIHIQQQPGYRSVNDWIAAIKLTWPTSSLAPIPSIQPVPEIPTRLYASSPTRGQINLSWTPAAGVSTYLIGRSRYPGGPYKTDTIAGTSAGYLNYGLTPGYRYYYVVAAQNASGTSATSNEVSAVARY